MTYLLIILVFALVVGPIAKAIFMAPTKGDDYNPSRHRGRKSKMRTNILSKTSEKKFRM